LRGGVGPGHFTFIFNGFTGFFPIRKIGQRLRRKSGQMQGWAAEIINRIYHNLAAIKEVWAFGLEKQEVGSYRRTCDAFSDAFLKVVKYQLIVVPLVEIISATGVGFAMFYASQRGLKLNVFMSLTMALCFAYDAIKRLGNISNKIQTGIAAVDRIEAILNEPEKIVDPRNSVCVGKLRGDIKFCDVVFSYARNREVLKKINVEMARGRTYALVRASRAGKSTFVNMI
jgi:subfamily B ATP-binding cassette protein MsbA